MAILPLCCLSSPWYIFAFPCVSVPLPPPSCFSLCPPVVSLGRDCEGKVRWLLWQQQRMTGRMAGSSICVSVCVCLCVRMCDYELFNCICILQCMSWMFTLALWWISLILSKSIKKYTKLAVCKREETRREEAQYGGPQKTTRNETTKHCCIIEKTIH